MHNYYLQLLLILSFFVGIWVLFIVCLFIGYYMLWVCLTLLVRYSYSHFLEAPWQSFPGKPFFTIVSCLFILLFSSMPFQMWMNLAPLYIYSLFFSCIYSNILHILFQDLMKVDHITFSTKIMISSHSSVVPSRVMGQNWYVSCSVWLRSMHQASSS